MCAVVLDERAGGEGGGRGTRRENESERVQGRRTRWRRPSYRYIHSQPRNIFQARVEQKCGECPKSGRLPRRLIPKTGPFSPEWKVSVSIALPVWGGLSSIAFSTRGGRCVRVRALPACDPRAIPPSATAPACPCLLLLGWPRQHRRGGLQEHGHCTGSSPYQRTSGHPPVSHPARHARLSAARVSASSSLSSAR